MPESSSGVFDSILNMRETRPPGFGSRTGNTSTAQTRTIETTVKVPGEAFVAFWFKRLEDFRMIEDRFLQRGDPFESRGHRAAIAILIAEGESLLYRLEDKLESTDFTKDDVEAALYSLRITDRVTYENTTTPELSAKVLALFEQEK